jgi:hypothetical protein
MLVDDLARLSNDDLAARPLPAFPKLALWLLRYARDSARLLDSFDAWTPSMLELERTRSGRKVRASTPGVDLIDLHERRVAIDRPADLDVGHHRMADPDLGADGPAPSIMPIGQCHDSLTAVV